MHTLYHDSFNIRSHPLSSYNQMFYSTFISNLYNQVGKLCLEKSFEPKELTTSEIGTIIYYFSLLTRLENRRETK